MKPPLFVSGKEQLATGDGLSEMTGLELMTGVLDGSLPSPPICSVMGFRLSAVAGGEVSFSGTPSFEHCNPHGTVHGGWSGTLLDSAMACAYLTTLPRGAGYTTLEYKVNLIRSIPLGTQVVATGTVAHSGRTTGVATGRICGLEDGRLYATGSTTCIAMRRKG